ncbi:LAMI_0H13278g1_1 [Lachancea mirantina]|uniref:LAMI_0H13278g1_1 n=1 Tax=Lachancea mirantina TaxID=1230905 RepID=A0A1G4KI63_9SACH|nr:LAMI_0H13278g1_1 [Lachancea mirantina]
MLSQGRTQLVKIPSWFLQLRSITYLHSGTRIRGLKRDPAEYLRLSNGLLYSEIKPDQYHNKVRSRLNLEKYGIYLPDELIVQCFTHKSFAHGSMPYNEKLAALGAQFLKYQASIYSVSSQEKPLEQAAGAEISPNSINGLEFSNLGTQFSKQLISKQTLSEVIKERGIDTLVFWKKRDPLKDAKFNGENSIFSSVLNAVVGGVLVTSGPEKASEFIGNELLDATKQSSLASIANKVV